MNIHRELAKYRLACLRSQEQRVRLQEAHHEAQEHGSDMTWDIEIESSLYVAISGVETALHNEICDAFDFRETPNAQEIKDILGQLVSLAAVTDQETAQHLAKHLETLLRLGSP